MNAVQDAVRAILDSMMSPLSPESDQSEGEGEGTQYADEGEGGLTRWLGGTDKRNKPKGSHGHICQSFKCQ